METPPPPAAPKNKKERAKARRQEKVKNESIKKAEAEKKALEYKARVFQILALIWLFVKHFCEQFWITRERWKVALICFFYIYK